MALPVPNNLLEVNLDMHLKDVTTSGAGLCFASVPAPFRGRLLRVYAAQYAGVSGGASVVTTKINSTTVSGATLTLASGTASPGQVYTAYPTDRSTTHFIENDIINFTSDGGSANGTIPATFTAVVRRV